MVDKTKSPEIDPHTWSQLLHDRGERTVSHRWFLKQLDMLMQKSRMNLDADCTFFSKIFSKRFRDQPRYKMQRKTGCLVDLGLVMTA
jgi:hypothetical protein